MNNTSYQNYKKPIKMWCIVQIAASVVAFLAIIFLFFLPNFHIDMTEVPSDIKTTLPKIENLADDIFKDLGDATDFDDLLVALEKSTSIDFSFYDEIYATINPVKVEGFVGAAFSSFSIFQIFAGIFFLAAAGLLVFSIVKNVLGIVSLDDFALKTYDSLKRREKKSGYARIYSPTYFFISGVMFEFLAVFFSKMFGGTLETKLVMSYFSLMTGLSGVAALSIVFILITLTGFGVAKYMKGKISSDILKEEYGERETNSLNAETENQ